MVSDIFGVLLNELGPLINVPSLNPDENSRCVVKMTNDVLVEFEMDRTADFLIMGTEIGVVSPGRYRIDVFREALKANALPLPRFGLFAWNKKSNLLILFKRFPLKDLNGEKIASAIPLFSENALKWKEAIERGEIPLVNSMNGPVARGGIFGLIR